jgi:hypothetical protein
MEQLTEAERAAVVAAIPVGRFCEPAEVAHVVKFLISPLAGFITGEVIDVNGVSGWSQGKDWARGGTAIETMLVALYAGLPHGLTGLGVGDGEMVLGAHVVDQSLHA